MFAKHQVEEIAQQILSKLPAPVQQAKSELDTVIRQVLQNKLAEFNFVTREEFEVQQQILLKNRQLLEALELKIARLESTEKVEENINVHLAAEQTKPNSPN